MTLARPLAGRALRHLGTVPTRSAGMPVARLSYFTSHGTRRSDGPRWISSDSHDAASFPGDGVGGDAPRRPGCQRDLARGFARTPPTARVGVTEGEPPPGGRWLREERKIGVHPRAVAHDFSFRQNKARQRPSSSYGWPPGKSRRRRGESGARVSSTISQRTPERWLGRTNICGA